MVIVLGGCQHTPGPFRLKYGLGNLNPEGNTFLSRAQGSAWVRTPPSNSEWPDVDLKVVAARMSINRSKQIAFKKHLGAVRLCQIAGRVNILHMFLQCLPKQVNHKIPLAAGSDADKPEALAPRFHPSPVTRNWLWKLALPV